MGENVDTRVEPSPMGVEACGMQDDRQSAFMTGCDDSIEKFW